MWFAFSVLLGLAALAGALVELARRRELYPLYERGCAGRRWHQCFPDASANEIREFLQFFVDAFGFPKKRRLLFRPDDTVLGLYHALYPPNWSIGDNMEFEEFADGLLSHYAVTLRDIWHDQLTLGEIFQQTRGESKSP
jgi:propanediol dehydratase small subunit